MRDCALSKFDPRLLVAAYETTQAQYQAIPDLRVRHFRGRPGRIHSLELAVRFAGCDRTRASS